MDPITTTHIRLYRARLSRVVAGIALILTTPAMLFAAAHHQGPLIMAAGWGVSALLLVLIRLYPPPQEFVEQASTRLATWSLRLPLAGIALLAPLTIHALFTVFIGQMDLREFSSWMGISALVVGQAHLFLAWYAARDGKRMMMADADLMPWKTASWKALWKTTIAACVPSVVFMAVPPILTVLTGAVFIPVMYYAAHRISAWERVRLEWLHLAERTGLTITTRPKPRLPMLSGVIDGIPVELEGWRMATGDIMYDLEVVLDVPALADLHISSRNTDPADLRLGEPVADSILRISTRGDHDASGLAQAIQNPDCYAALMEMVHGNGGFIIRGRIRLMVSQTTLEPVWKALPMLVDLARLLNQHTPSINESPVSSRRKVAQASPAR